MPSWGVRPDSGCGEGLGQVCPTVHLTHPDCPDASTAQSSIGHGLGAGENDPGFDPVAECLVEPFDGVGGAHRFPQGRCKAGEAEQWIISFFQAVSNGATLEPLLAEKGFVALLHLGHSIGMDHDVGFRQSTN